MAAEQGLIEAQYNLSVMYVNGQGVKEDYVMRYVWAERAASGGDKYVIKLLDYLEKVMTPEQIAEARRRNSN